MGELTYLSRITAEEAELLQKFRACPLEGQQQIRAFAQAAYQHYQPKQLAEVLPFLVMR